MLSLAALAPTLGNVAVKATVVLFMAAILVRVMRRVSAASRHAVWTAAFCAILLLPVAAAVLPAVPLRVLPAHAVDRAAAMRPGGGDRTLAVTAIDAGTTTETHVTRQLAPRQPNHSTWAGVLAAVWFIGVLTLLARGAVGTLGVRRLARGAERTSDPRLLSRVERLAERLKVRRPVTTLVAAGEWMPLTWGVCRPALLLPSSAPAWSDERLDAVLVHELAHVARLDALSQLVARLALVLMWFNPLAWFAARAARLERERACDDRVLAHGTRPSRYADDLLALAQSLTAPTMAWSGALTTARGSQFEWRLDAILDARVNRRGLSRMGGALAAALMLIAAPVAAAHLASRPDVVRAQRADLGAATFESIQTPQLQLSSGAPDPIRPSERPAARPAPPRQEEIAAPELANELEQGQPAPVNFSGTWTPRDPQRTQALFAVGLAPIPGDCTLTIVQDSKTLTVSYTDPSGMLEARARIGTAFDAEIRTVYSLDGSETRTTSRSGAEVVNTARWDGNKLVITTTTPWGDWQTVYSMEGEDLRIERRGDRGVTVLLCKRVT